MICPLCEKGTLTKKEVPYLVYGIQLGIFPTNSCNSCGEQWFDEKTSKKIEELEKKKGLFGLAKKSKISYSGNSLIIRIPEQLAKFMGIKKEDGIILHPEGKNKITVELTG
ncbi:AbrB/MazE/SpoVT family DNA-binding domain-containing protein [Candidatus Woesearchaeota archaeon]|nr:AbrB/MazE/SpoVT family DNA-binding domain-containing protein [Candidatus Woesearchaeota archaeon]